MLTEMDVTYRVGRERLSENEPDDIVIASEAKQSEPPRDGLLRRCAPRNDRLLVFSDSV